MKDKLYTHEDGAAIARLVTTKGQTGEFNGFVYLYVWEETYHNKK